MLPLKDLRGIFRPSGRPGAPSVQGAVRNSQLDLLRGIALLGVIVVHTHQEFPSFLYGLSWTLSQADPFFLGRHGVQLFFAVSGFTMVMVYENYRGAWRDPAGVFYIRRIFRLYPLLFISAFAYLLVPLKSDAIFNPDGVQPADFIRLLTLTGGWSPQYLNVLVPGVWSVINEIYFYFLFPLLWMVRGSLGALGAGIFIAGANILLVLHAPVLYPGQDPWLVGDFMYRNLLVNLICFHAGIEAFRFLRDRSVDFVWLVIPLLIGGVVLELVEAGSQGMIRSEVLKLALLACLFHILLVLVQLPNLAGLCRNRWLEGLGKVTYTAYIIHFAVIHYAGWLADTAGFRPYAPFEIVLPAMVLVTALMSRYLSRWTEGIWQDMADAVCRRLFVVRGVPVPAPRQASP